MNEFWLDIINTVARVVVSFAAPLLFAWGLKILHKKNLDTAWYEAIGRAGGVAWGTMVSNGTTITDHQGLKNAATAGAGYLQTFMAEQILTRGLTDSHLVQIVAAERDRQQSASSMSSGAVVANPGPGQEATATVQPEGTKT